MRLTGVILLFALSACAAPPLEEVPAFEPITDDSAYDPSAATAPVADPITSGPITAEPLASGPVVAAPLAPSSAAVAPLSDKERLVAAIEGEGCVLNAENSERVLNTLGIGQEQLAQIGSELMREGRVEVIPPAEFRLVTGACAS